MYRKTLRIHEIFEDAAKEKDRRKRIEFLRSHATTGLKDVLKGTYDKRAEWNLPEGSPPYTPADPSSVPTNLHSQTRQFNYFIKGGKGDAMQKVKREHLFIRLLEGIHPADALVVLAMKEGTAIKGVPRKLALEAFPNLFPE